MSTSNASKRDDSDGANSASTSSSGSSSLSALSTSNSFSGALARTAARAGALYFSRPARLFRPQKVSAWTSLRSIVQPDGRWLSPQNIASTFKQQGWNIFLHHLLPPVVINTAMGTILFTSYTGVSSVLSDVPVLQHRPTTVAYLSGACAGAVHGLVGAPLDNVARYLEGGAGGWRQAWKQAFRPPEMPDAIRGGLRHTDGKLGMPTVQEAREARHWMWEWRHMAGRGWHGWKWGAAKDITGFSAFFAVFDLSRRLGNHVALSVTSLTSSSPLPPTPIDFDPSLPSQPEQPHRPFLARAAHAVTLVGGGVLGGLLYEAFGRPWDVARELWIANHLPPPSPSTGQAVKPRPLPLPVLIAKALREKGLVYFFRSVRVSGSGTAEVVRGKWYMNFLPTLARVGPWGIAFLFWEFAGGSVIG